MAGGYGPETCGGGGGCNGLDGYAYKAANKKQK